MLIGPYGFGLRDFGTERAEAAGLQRPALSRDHQHFVVAVALVVAADRVHLLQLGPGRCGDGPRGERARFRRVVRRIYLGHHAAERIVVVARAPGRGQHQRGAVVASREPGRGRVAAQPHLVRRGVGIRRRHCQRQNYEDDCANRAATWQVAARFARTMRGMRTDWPDGADVAVSLTFDVDAESGWLGEGEAYARRLSTLSEGRYGVTRGLPRILEILRETRRAGDVLRPRRHGRAPHRRAAGGRGRRLRDRSSRLPAPAERRDLRGGAAGGDRARDGGAPGPARRHPARLPLALVGADAGDVRAARRARLRVGLEPDGRRSPVSARRAARVARALEPRRLAAPALAAGPRRRVHGAGGVPGHLAGRIRVGAGRAPARHLHDAPGGDRARIPGRFAGAADRRDARTRQGVVRRARRCGTLGGGDDVRRSTAPRRPARASAARRSDARRRKRSRTPSPSTGGCSPRCTASTRARRAETCDSRPRRTRRSPGSPPARAWTSSN